MSGSNLALPIASQGQGQGQGGVLGDWSIAGVYGSFPAGVLVQLERSTDDASLQIVLTPKGSQALTQTPLGAISYRKYAGIDHMEAADTARKFAELLTNGALPFSVLFPHLAFEAAPKAQDKETYLSLIAPNLKLLPGQVGDSALALLPRGVGHLHFDPPGIAEFFAPDLEIDGSPIGGFVLKSIYLPAAGKRESIDFSRYMLDFVHAKTGEPIRLRLNARGSGDGFGRVGELSLNIDGFSGHQDEVPSSIASLCSWILTLIRLKTADGMELFIPVETADVRAFSVPAGREVAERVADVSPGAKTEVSGPPQAFNLAIDTECHQQCAFCSVKSYVKPVDAGAAELENIRFQLRSTRQQGVEEVRLNGIDPLTYSRVLDVVESVKEYGFRKLSVYSTCRRFADATFRREFLRRAPQELLISIPVYGVTAAAHEAVTGAPGSFAQVMAALEGLLAEVPRHSLAITTVLVKQNLHEFLDVVRFATERGLPLHGHMPYPMKQTTRDPYTDSAARESVIVDEVVNKLQSLKSTDERRMALETVSHVLPHPCVLWKAEQRTKLPVFAMRAGERKHVLVGTEYRQNKFTHGSDSGQENAFAVATVPCPHVERCALAPICPGEHYAVYRQAFGLEEFAPVSVQDLYGASKHVKSDP